jgi:hypothetical protein
MESGLTWTQADAQLGTKIKQLIEEKKIPPGFEEEWFSVMLDENGALRDTYCQKRLTKTHLLELAKQPSDGIPTINFSR